MNLEITGILKVIKDIQVISDKFSKREFVIETISQYPQVIMLELQGSNCDIIDYYTIGQQITCLINLRGREWTNPEGEVKYFNTIVCFKIQKSNTMVGGFENASKTEIKTATIQKQNTKTEPKLDDLPFQKKNNLI